MIIIYDGVVYMIDEVVDVMGVRLVKKIKGLIVSRKLAVGNEVDEINGIYEIYCKNS